jgi:integrase
MKASKLSFKNKKERQCEKGGEKQNGRNIQTVKTNGNGIPVLIVSKRLGHSKPNITIDVYGHLIPSKQEKAALLIDNLMFAG